MKTHGCRSVIGFFLALLCSVHMLGAQVPTLTSFAPTFGPPGTLVTLTGTNFNANPNNMAVYIGRVRAPIVGGNTTSLQVRVPLGAASVDYVHVMDLTTNRGAISWSATTQQFTITNASPTTVNAGYFSQWTIPVGFVARGPLVTDFNGDGFPDIVASTAGQAVVFSRSGCTFSTTFFNQGDNSSAPQIGDFNQDGRVDLVVGGGSGGQMHLFERASNNMGFNPPILLSNPTTGTIIRGWIGDANADGRMDVVTNNSSSTTFVLFQRNAANTGYLTGLSTATSASTVIPGMLANKVADLNRDGRLDVVSGIYDGLPLNVHYNTGSSPFFNGSTSTFDHRNVNNIELADLNRDGVLDLITTDFISGRLDVSFLQCSGCTAPTVSSVFTGTGLNSPLDVVAGDLNGDGWADLVVTERFTTQLSIYINNQTGGFTRQVIALPSSPFELDVADANLDGYNDILVGLGLTNNVFILLGNNGPIPSLTGPSLALDATSSAPANVLRCVADTVSAAYTLSCPLNPGNNFFLELSDAVGSFAAPTLIASRASTTPGVLSGSIPPAVPDGAGYRLRIRSSDPALGDTTAAFAISSGTETLSAMPASATTLCVGAAITAPYVVGACTSSSATLQLQLSDASGSFAAPTVLTATTRSLTLGSNAGTLSATVPMGLALGTGYRVRVRWVEQGFVSADNGVNLSVPPTAPIGNKPTGPRLRCPSTARISLSTAPAVGAVSYQWQLVSGAGSFVGVPTGTTASFAPPTSASGYPLVFRVRGVDACGQLGAVSDTFTVHAPQSLGLFAHTLTAPPPPYCVGTDVGLVVQGSRLGQTYGLVVNGTTRATVPGSGANLPLTVSATWLNTGANSVSVTTTVVTDSGACTEAVAPMPLTLTVSPAVVAPGAMAANVCSRAAGLVAFSPVAGLNYRLLSGMTVLMPPQAVLGPTGFTLAPALLSPPASNFTLEVSSPSGCGAPLTQPLTIGVLDSAALPMPLMASYMGSEILAGETAVTFAAPGASGVASYLWDFGTGETSNLPSPTYTFAREGTYAVTLTADPGNGCPPTRRSLLIDVIFETLYIPNVFTPNGDGVNDFFTPRLPPIRSYEVLIHDRWGRVVHRSNVPFPGWSGRTDSGSECAAGVYAYVIKVALANGETVERTGMLSLLR